MNPLPTASDAATFVETLNAWSTFAAATATTLSALFIAWQIWLTRKSVQTTEATLVVARDEFEHSRRLRIDAQKAAIDAEMPKLFVTVKIPPTFVFATDDREPDMLAETKSRPRRLATGDGFVLPRDANLRLEVVASILVANDGPRRAFIELGAPYSPDRRVRRRLIDVGDSVTLTANRSATVGEWVRIAEMRARGESEQVTFADVVYIFPGDASAIERHEIAQGGTVLEPDPDQTGRWLVRSLAQNDDVTAQALGTEVQPFTREYWASRRDEHRL
ncbi:hypothetical protein JOF42_000347 [Microbacterium phyllosphaerae]|uniref:Uncharacterized protein n=1 Tax=Microbacterium phyllosphaerae TaxID=124798 RepID=A0ABS4WKY1_9MICO|nr:hypothetical protein [Microbacterium phyllosphaerae]MBP2376852.1 hypothetical protein [Microbacterium phyllosphaerae]